MKKIFLLSWIICFSLCCDPFSLKTTYQYLEQTGDDQSVTTWSFKNKKALLLIYGNDSVSKTYIECSHDFIESTYKYENPVENTIFTLIRNKDKITAKGKIKGEEIEIIHDVGDGNWVQNVGFGLQNFVRSKKTSYSFFKINPNNLDLVEMVAKKEDVETIKIQNKKYEAIPVRISLPGTKSLFWHAYAWFDAQTYLFLKYQGNSGPGTDDTIITLKNQ